ncbi:hypothetical protein CR513_04918, partial [Mucuna pruriens]
MKCHSTLCCFAKFSTFGVPKALINDQGSHFYNRTMATLLEKYGVACNMARDKGRIQDGKETENRKENN